MKTAIALANHCFSLLSTAVILNHGIPAHDAHAEKFHILGEVFRVVLVPDGESFKSIAGDLSDEIAVRPAFDCHGERLPRKGPQNRRIVEERAVGSTRLVRGAFLAASRWQAP
jgi:hypothetical protein